MRSIPGSSRGRALLGRWIALICAGACSVTAFAQDGAQPPARPTPPMQRGPGIPLFCPMWIEGTQVSARDTSVTAILEFTNPSADKRPQLRERVQAWAMRHNRASQHLAGMRGPMAQGRMGQGMYGPGMMPGGMGMQGMGGAGMRGGMPGYGQGMGACLLTPIPATATAQATAQGARIVLVPQDPNQLVALQRSVRARAEQLRSGSCGGVGGCRGPVGTGQGAPVQNQGATPAHP